MIEFPVSFPLDVYTYELFIYDATEDVYQSFTKYDREEKQINRLIWII